MFRELEINGGTCNWWVSCHGYHCCAIPQAISKMSHMQRCRDIYTHLLTYTHTLTNTCSLSLSLSLSLSSLSLTHTHTHTHSTSVGRSGTFCVMSSVLEQLKVEGIVDLFFTIHSLRQQQPGLVQTPVSWRKREIKIPL